MRLSLQLSVRRLLITVTILGVDLLERQEIFLNQTVRGYENAKEPNLW